MPYRMSLLFAMVLAVLIAATGCRSSKKTGSPEPALSTPRSEKAKPPVATPIEVQPTVSSPINVQPPASFRRTQLPQDGIVEFLVSGNAGEFLVVKVNEVINSQYEETLPHTTTDTSDARYSIAVRMADGGGSILKALQRGGACTNNSLYKLPQSGRYKVALDASPGRRFGRTYGVDFTLLPGNDPLIDPGLTPEQISIDFGGFAKDKHLAVVPLTMIEGCIDDSWPSHLAIEGGSFEFRIMPAAGYTKLFPLDDGMGLLKSALKPGGESIPPSRFPYAAAYGDAGSVMTARREFLQGEGWHGLRWIGGYAQDGDYPGDLGYMFEGTTDDNRFLILMRASISHSDLQRWSPNINQSNDKRAREETAMRIRLEKALAAAAPGSFQPDLKQLDAVIESLRFIH